jgi:hypothetical protein
MYGTVILSTSMAIKCQMDYILSNPIQFNVTSNFLSNSLPNYNYHLEADGDVKYVQFGSTDPDIPANNTLALAGKIKSPENQYNISFVYSGASTS